MPAVLAVFEPGSGVTNGAVDVLSGAVTRMVLDWTTTEATGVKLVLLEVGDGGDGEDDDDMAVVLELESGL